MSKEPANRERVVNRLDIASKLRLEATLPQPEKADRLSPSRPRTLLGRLATPADRDGLVIGITEARGEISDCD